MKLYTLSTARTLRAALPSLLTALLVSPAGVQAQVVNYQWTGAGGDNAWTNALNWSTPPGGVLGRTSATWSDRVSIDGAVHVIYEPGSTDPNPVIFYNPAPVGKEGTFYAFSLTNGASATLGPGLRVQSATGVIRNVLVDTGSALSLGIMAAGTATNTVNSSTWDINGSIIADSFRGYQSTSTNNGGYILNINRGSLSIASSFNWQYQGSETRNSKGQINLTNGGTLTVGSMHSNWIYSSEQFVQLDRSASSFSFGKTNYETRSSVEALVASGHLRRSVTGVLNLVDNGDHWTVTSQALTKFRWTGEAGDSDWSNGANWTVDLGPNQIRSGNGGPGIVSSTSGDTRPDSAVITGPVTVRYSGDIAFSGVGEGGSQTVFEVAGGANVEIDGNLNVYSNAGTQGSKREVKIDEGSKLTVIGNLRVGAPAATSRNSEWEIKGHVVATNFQGYKTTADSSTTSLGGFVINLDGGILEVDTWSWNANAMSNPDSIGQINISNDGLLDIGISQEDWLSSTNNTVNFVDGSGTFQLGYENWGTLELVEDLIIDGYIRTAMAGGTFQIMDNGSGWTITVIPEPSTYALLGIAALGLAWRIRRK